MLGCHDFCGHYEWTFHYLRRRFGQQAIQDYWRDAIAGDSQSHYIQAALREGLRGLYKTWVQTGLDEQCDWFVELHEEENLLRLDMHRCPSKGFLLDNNRNADEDYCDHCIGWIAPAMAACGLEVTTHEHNHCGQCLWEIRSPQQPQPAVAAARDIRAHPEWNHGYLDRFAHGTKLPVTGEHGPIDYADLLVQSFSHVKRLGIIGPFQETQPLPDDDELALIVDGRTYVDMAETAHQIAAIMLGNDPSPLPRLAERYHATAKPPLLLHAFLPGAPPLDLLRYHLPRALPILPLLIRRGLYTHDPRVPPPLPHMFCLLVAKALGLPIIMRESS